MTDKRKRSRLIVGLTALAVCCSLLTAAIVNSLRMERAMERAVALIEEEDCAGAAAALEPVYGIRLKLFEDAKPVDTLYEAMRAYADGKLTEAYFALYPGRSKGMNCFKNLPKEQRTVIEAFWTRFSEEWDAMKREDEAEREAKLRNELRDSLPYTGLPEECIAYTSLGKPARSAFYSGKAGTLNTYTFESDGRITYIVECRNGYVSEVTDWAKSNPPLSEKEKRRLLESLTEDDGDPYDAKDYTNEEDFYDEHYDDFFDYYEAEEYYRDHCD